MRQNRVDDDQAKRSIALTAWGTSLGADMAGWPGERWVDVRRQEVRSIMKKRLDYCQAVKCDGVDPGGRRAVRRVTRCACCTHAGGDGPGGRCLHGGAAVTSAPAAAAAAALWTAQRAAALLHAPCRAPCRSALALPVPIGTRRWLTSCARLLHLQTT